MLVAEARWLGHALEGVDVAALSPMLNVGSHTVEFRTRVQPWIEKYVFGPLVARGVQISYADLRPAEGVDHVGDLTDPAFVAELHGYGYRSVVCSNLLEHVPDPSLMAASLLDLLPADGTVIFSGPRHFPYHADPIDNMFRPSLGEITASFPGTRIVAGDEVSCGTFATYVLRRVAASPGRVVRDLRRKSHTEAPAVTTTAVATPRTGDDLAARGRSTAATLAPWLVRRFSVTCAILQKQAAAS